MYARSVLEREDKISTIFSYGRSFSAPMVVEWSSAVVEKERGWAYVTEQNRVTEHVAGDIKNITVTGKWVKNKGQLKAEIDVVIGFVSVVLDVTYEIDDILSYCMHSGHRRRNKRSNMHTRVYDKSGRQIRPQIRQSQANQNRPINELPVYQRTKRDCHPHHRGLILVR